MVDSFSFVFGFLAEITNFNVMEMKKGNRPVAVQVPVSPVYGSTPSSPATKLIEKRWWTFPLLFTLSLLMVFLFFVTSNLSLISTQSTTSALYTSPVRALNETRLRQPAENSTNSVPRLAYLVSGSKGDLDRLWRTLFSLYHPRNQYVVHLDLKSPVTEREELRRRVMEEPVFRDVGNVHVIEKANMVTYRGPTMVSNTLHACAILLRRSKNWDWFINLSASDYPLVTQDDLLYIFSKVPRNLNFIEHTSDLGWKKEHRGKPLIVDPGLFMTKNYDIFWTHDKRELPTSFKLFTGSAWMALTRDFVEYMIWGWDNLPRTLLMYYTNFVSSPEGYFHTVICNSPEFNNTVVNHDLHYISWDNPPKQHPQTLSVDHIAAMIASGAPFARKFPREDPVLDRVDKDLLGRRKGSFSPGGWCNGEPKCSAVGDTERLIPRQKSKMVARMIKKLIQNRKKHQCL